MNKKNKEANKKNDNQINESIKEQIENCVSGKSDESKISG